MALPLCGFSGEYEMVQGSQLCCAGWAGLGATAVANKGRNACLSCLGWTPGWRQGALSLPDKGTRSKCLLLPLLASVLHSSVFLSTWHMLEQGL